MLATNPATGKTTARTVLNEWNHFAGKNLARVTIGADAKRDGKAGAVIAAYNHEFWLPKLKQWVRADQLKTGMWLCTSAGVHVQITAT